MKQPHLTQLKKHYTPRFLVMLFIVLSINYGALWLFWRTPWIVFAITLLGSALLFALLPKPRIALTYFFLATTMPLTEALAVSIGIWRYTTPSFLGIPAYLFPIWGNVAIMALIFYKALRSFFDEAMPRFHTRTQWRRHAILFFCFTGLSLAILLLFWRQALLASVLLLLVKLIQIAFFHKTERRTLSALFFLTMLSGAVIGEITSVLLGIWHYNTATIFGIPLFIYIAWGGTGVIIAEFYTLLSAPFIAKYLNIHTKNIYHSLFYDARGVIIGISLIVSYCASFFLWRTPLLPLVILSAISIILLALFRSRKLLVLYCIGGILGTLMEAHSTTLGIWHYTLPQWRGVPLYLFPIWGNTVLFAVAAFKKIAGTMEGDFIPYTHKSALRHFFLASLITALALWTLWTFWHAVTITAILLIILSGALIFSQPHPHITLRVYGATMLGGLLSDLFGIPLGIWAYSVSTLHGIPLFMLFAWGIAGTVFVILYNVMARITWLNRASS